MAPTTNVYLWLAGVKKSEIYRQTSQDKDLVVCHPCLLLNQACQSWQSQNVLKIDIKISLTICRPVVMRWNEWITLPPIKIIITQDVGNYQIMFQLFPLHRSCDFYFILIDDYCESLSLFSFTPDFLWPLLMILVQ